MWVLISGLCTASLEVLDQVTNLLQAENGQKVDNFEPIYLNGKANLTTKHNHKLNTQNSMTDVIINKKIEIENRKKKFNHNLTSKPSNWRFPNIACDVIL